MIMEDVSIKRSGKVLTFENLLPATKTGDKAVRIRNFVQSLDCSG